MRRRAWWLGEWTGIAIAVVGWVVYVAGDDQGFQILVAGGLCSWACTVLGWAQGHEEEP